MRKTGAGQSHEAADKKRASIDHSGDGNVNKPERKHVEVLVCSRCHRQCPGELVAVL